MTTTFTMQLIIHIATFTLFFLTCLAAIGQASDSTVQVVQLVQADTLTTITTTDPYEGSGDFSPGLLVFAMIGVAFILATVGAGMVLTVLGLLIIFGLILTGILSASIITGLNKKSFEIGFKTFLVSSSTTGGTFFGLSCFWLLNKTFHWWPTSTAIISGAICGLVAGVGFGFLVFYLLQRLTTYFK